MEDLDPSIMHNNNIITLHTLVCIIYILTCVSFSSVYLYQDIKISC